ncbi:MAG: hypothetical protein VR72_15990 [Clostridiaceae bacterium BRH_c20a]|nr:MAG: hypothetical protein VR72_15990 [Clostridiaceae bacterium BRH_c20a]
MHSTIKVEYLGTVRLLIKKKFDIYTFTVNPTLGLLVQEIGGRYGKIIGQECKKQVFIICEPKSDRGIFYKLPKDANILLKQGSVVKILNNITGG